MKEGVPMADTIEKSLVDLDFASLTRRTFTPSPAAWDDQVLYFLLLDRFSDGNEQGGYRDSDGRPASGVTWLYRPEDPALVRQDAALREQLKVEFVEDPVARIRFPKYLASCTLERDGQTYFFVDEETRREFEKQPGGSNHVDKAMRYSLTRRCKIRRLSFTLFGPTLEFNHE
jgi:YHS domain-containing protein